MSTDLEQRLRDALHEDAERARLVNPDGPPVPEALPLVVEEHHRRRSPRKLVAVAAALALIAAATVALTQDQDDSPELDTAPLVIPDLQPGSTVPLPPAPLGVRETPALVWSGSEMIVWGGFGGGGPVDDGAAFDPTTGDWRGIAPAPIAPRDLPQVAWTGSEMLVVGGYREGVMGEEAGRDGAAYDPSTDTWRTLPEVPIAVGSGARSVWTGEELIVVGGISFATAAAYRPDTNEWRKLAEPPALDPSSFVWAGEAALMTIQDPNSPEGPTSLVRYDPGADEWQAVEATGYPYLVAVRDGDGEVRSVVALPTELGAPVAVLDRSGNVAGTLPPHPGDPEIYGTKLLGRLGRPYADQGIWTGDEALFWIQGSDSPYGSFQRPAPWALDPETGTWRELGESAPPLGVHLELVGNTGVLIGWGPVSSDEGSPSTGIAYRPPAQGGAVPPLERPLGLPEPGAQPVDPASAEEQVRAAYLQLGDTDIPVDERAPFSERPAVWADAAGQVKGGQYWDIIQGIREQVDEVVFVSPTHAFVRFQLVSEDPIVPREHIGEALLVDGRWVMAIATSCDLFSLAGVTCDLSL